MKTMLGLSLPSLLVAVRVWSQAPVNYQTQEGFVDARGVLIYYRILGQGSPLVVVHGGPGASYDYFLPYLLPLARRHGFIFIDKRGSGGSERLEDKSVYTVESMVGDAEAVRQALKLGRISLPGHSYGGVLAQAYALKYLANLTHLILCSTFHSTSSMNAVFHDHFRLAFDRPGTRSQKCNLIWDKILELNLFPKEVARKEIRFYLRNLNPFGLPRDNRKDYTKIAWILWTATLAARQEDFLPLVSGAYAFADKTPDRVPLSDWCDTKTAKGIAFQARPVIGGLFIKMLADPGLWKKWSRW
jgi:pimeloyl-ACP methyl ester carboxylesterase